MTSIEFYRLSGLPLQYMKLMSDMNEEERKTILGFIKENLIPRKTVNRHHSSYDLRILVISITGIFLSESQLKDAMFISGFSPIDWKEYHWHFRISDKSPIFRSIMADDDIESDIVCVADIPKKVDDIVIGMDKLVSILRCRALAYPLIGTGLKNDIVKAIESHQWPDGLMKINERAWYDYLRPFGCKVRTV